MLASPLVSDPLRLLDICATSRRRRRGGAHEPRTGAGRDAVRLAGGVDRHADLPQRRPRPARHRDGLRRGRARRRSSPTATRSPRRPTSEAGLGPEDLDLAEVYDLSTALELDWYEDIGLCKTGEAERLLRDGDTTLGGRIPVNPSGGLACFGEAVPAQALAQVCELTWQLRGQAAGRQVEGARIGLTINQGLFGHGSSVILTR